MCKSAKAMGSAVEVLIFEHACVYSPFLIERMFVWEPSWEYSANLVGS